LKSKIAIVIGGYTKVGGGERIAVELCERLAQRFDLHVICREIHIHTPGVTFHKVIRINFPRSLKRIIFAWQVKRVLDKLKPDLIHTHERIFNADIYSMHGTPPRHWAEKVLNRPMNLFDRSIAYLDRCLIESKRCRVLLPVSRLVEIAYQKEYRLLNEKYFSPFPPGVDDRFQPRPSEGERGSWRQSLNTPDEATVCIFVSQNWEHKGLITLFEALSLFEEDNRPHLWVVGNGSKKKFQQRAQKLGIETSVRFTGVVKEELPSLYRSADYFVLPSKFDTFALVVLEAMACGLPVVVSSTVGASQLVKEGETGYVLEDWQDHLCLKNRMEKLLVKNMLIKMGKLAALRADKYRWKRITRELEIFYHDTIKNSLGQ
jgi:UDP-glucose:(heptosyl)LPS alpha-1,3-glucosyltransferase